MAVILAYPFTGIVMTIYFIYRFVYFLMNWMGSGFESFESEENRRINRFKGCLIIFIIWIILAVFEYSYLLMMAATLGPSEVPEYLMLRYQEYYLMLGFLMLIDIIWQICQLRDYIWTVFDTHFHLHSKHQSNTDFIE